MLRWTVDMVQFSRESVHAFNLFCLSIFISLHQDDTINQLKDRPVFLLHYNEFIYPNMGGIKEKPMSSLLEQLAVWARN